MSAFLLTSSFAAGLDSTFYGFDYAVFSFFGGIQNSFLTALSKAFTALGTTQFIVMFALMGLVMIFFRRTRKAGLAIVFSVIITALIVNVLLKPAVERIRPYNTLQNDAAYWSWYVGAGMLSEADYCFPSGHTSSATAVCAALMICHLTSKRKGAKAFCWVFPLTAVLVGASRVYLMVHYATDVLGGFIAGAVSGVLGYFLASLVCAGQKKSEETQTLFKRNIRPGGITAIIFAFLVIYIISAAHIRKTGGEDALRCAYDIDYDCQNEAETGSKYPPIDGKYYCKIHYADFSD